MRRTKELAGALLILTIVAGGALSLLILRVPASAGAEPSPLPTFSIPPRDTPLPQHVQAQLDALPPGTRIVDCLPGVARMPEGLVVNRDPTFESWHPGFRYLADGYCADNPAATPIPIRMDSADGPSSP
jgi:hypothetical protein